MPTKLIVSTAMMGQANPEQWLEVVEEAERVWGKGQVGLEMVAIKEPLMGLIVRRLKHLGLAERVVTIHGRVDYDLDAFLGRLKHISPLKSLELAAYDLLMPLVGETYRSMKRLPQAKLLLHAPTLFQLASLKGKKPRLRGAKIIVENDEKQSPVLGDENMAEQMAKLGNPLNPVDVLRFAVKRKLAKVVFDTAHFWRMSPKGEEREKLWAEFKLAAEKSSLPIYWHMNHDDGDYWLIHLRGRQFASEHDKWLAQVCRFAGERVKTGADQICLEEPRRVAVRLSGKALEEVKQGIARSIRCLVEYGAI